MEYPSTDVYNFTILSVIDSEEGLIKQLDSLHDYQLNDLRIQWVFLNRSDGVDRLRAISSVSKIQIDGIDIECVQFDPSSRISECYKCALAYIKGEFVCFTNEHMIYQTIVFLNVQASIKNHLDVSFFALNYRKYEKNCAIDKGGSDFALIGLPSDSNLVHFFAPSVFIKSSIIGEVSFSDVCEEESSTLFILDILKRIEQVAYLKNTFCYYDSDFSQKVDDYYGCSDKSFYIDSLKFNYLPFLESFPEGCVPQWAVRAVYYQLYFKYYSNLNLRNKYLLDKDELVEFLELSQQILQYVPDYLILDNIESHQFKPPLSIREAFLNIKYHDCAKDLSHRFYISNGVLYFEQCGCEYSLKDHMDLKVMAFNLKDGQLIIDLRFFYWKLYEFDPHAISVECDQHSYPCICRHEYSFDKLFGVPAKKCYSFQVSIPLKNNPTHQTDITFYLSLSDKKIALPLNFFRTPSKLLNNCKFSYWRMDKNHILQYREPSLRIYTVTRRELLLKEGVFEKAAALQIYGMKNLPLSRRHYICQMLWLRQVYFLTRSYYSQKRIWLYFDKLYKGGDNGEYAFRYAMKNDSDIEAYYIINKDTGDYARLLKEFPNNIIPFGSRKCMLYALAAETIVATHPDIIEFFGFDKVAKRYFKDLFNANLVCIAHGVTIQKNADYQNRLFDNTMFYTTSSKYEVRHIMKPIYGYSKDEVALTGMARFDGLVNKDKKQVLISPTWRRNLVGATRRNSTQSYSNRFKESDYFKIYNRLINDKRLIRLAQQKGYRIIFLLHPSMSAQACDYDRNDYVELVQATGDMSYEKILTESSLLVTDYSGIHYDFAYMRKPIVYYQPKEVPMRFEEGGMVFETMGFGPVCSEYEDAVRLICKSIESDCVEPPEFKKRADDFFEFDDYNNCQRIHEAIKAWTANNGRNR